MVQKGCPREPQQVTCHRYGAEDIQAFDALPFKNKFIFTSKDIPTESNVFMNEFAKAGEVGDPYRNGHVFYRYLTQRLTKTKNIDQLFAFNT